MHRSSPGRDLAAGSRFAAARTSSTVWPLFGRVQTRRHRSLETCMGGTVIHAYETAEDITSRGSQQLSGDGLVGRTDLADIAAQNLGNSLCAGGDPQA